MLVGLPDLRRETVESHLPFSREDFLSGADSGRVYLIRAWSGLGLSSVYLDLSSDFRTIFQRKFCGSVRFEIRAYNRRFRECYQFGDDGSGLKA